MKKLLLLALLLIGSSSFSQNPYRINQTLNDGGSGRYRFKVQGEIIFGRKIFDTDKTKDAPKMHLPVSFRNVRIVSITTPNGKTYTNNDLVYQTNSQRYPNGIKLPINLSNTDAQKHFKIYGEVNFNGTYTPFIKSLTNTSYAKDNEFWIDNHRFKYEIKERIISKLENQKKLDGLNNKEKNIIINNELERLFYSNIPPRVNKLILEPYGSNKDLNNLMRLASETDSRGNTGNNNPNQQNDDNPGSGDDSQETPKQTGANPNQQTNNNPNQVLEDKLLHEEKMKQLTSDFSNKVDELSQGNQITSGSLKGAMAITLASNGRVDSDLIAGAATDVVSGLIKNRADKVANANSALSSDLNLYDKLYKEFTNSISKNEYKIAKKTESVLRYVEDNIITNSLFLKKEELIVKIHSNQKQRVELLLAINSKNIYNQISKPNLWRNLTKLQFIELAYQSRAGKQFESFRSLTNRQDEDLFNLINIEQINRVKRFLNLNVNTKTFNRTTEALIYLTSNYKNELFDKRTIETFKKLNVKNKKTVMLYTILFGAVDRRGYFEVTKTNNINQLEGYSRNHVDNSDKVLLLLGDGDLFNYYNDKFGPYDFIGIHKTLKFSEFINKISGFQNGVYTYFFDPDKLIKKRIKELMKNDENITGKSKKRLIKERKNCITANCSSQTINNNFDLITLINTSAFELDRYLWFKDKSLLKLNLLDVIGMNMKNYWSE